MNFNVLQTELGKFSLIGKKWDNGTNLSCHFSMAVLMGEALSKPVCHMLCAL